MSAPLLALLGLLLAADASAAPGTRIELALMEAGDSMIVNKLALEEMKIKFTALPIPWYRDPADGLVKANISAMAEADGKELLRLAPHAEVILNGWPTYQPIMYDQLENMTLTNAYSNIQYLNNAFEKKLLPPISKTNAGKRARAIQMMYTMEMQSTIWRDAVACYDRRTGALSKVNRTEAPAEVECSDEEWARLVKAVRLELDYIHGALTEGWIAGIGKNFSLADVAMLPRLFLYEYHGVNFPRGWPAIAEYLDLHRSRPSVVKAIPARWFGEKTGALAQVTRGRTLGSTMPGTDEPLEPAGDPVCCIDMGYYCAPAPCPDYGR